MKAGRGSELKAGRMTGPGQHEGRHPSCGCAVDCIWRPVYGGEGKMGEKNKTPIPCGLLDRRSFSCSVRRPFFCRFLRGSFATSHSSVAASGHYTTVFNFCQQFLILLARLSPQVLVRQRFRSPDICRTFPCLPPLEGPLRKYAQVQAGKGVGNSSPPPRRGARNGRRRKFFADFSPPAIGGSREQGVRSTKYTVSSPDRIVARSGRCVLSTAYFSPAAPRG